MLPARDTSSTIALVPLSRATWNPSNSVSASASSSLLASTNLTVVPACNVAATAVSAISAATWAAYKERRKSGAQICAGENQIFQPRPRRGQRIVHLVSRIVAGTGMQQHRGSAIVGAAYRGAVGFEPIGADIDPIAVHVPFLNYVLNSQFLLPEPRTYRRSTCRGVLSATLIDTRNCGIPFAVSTLTCL